MTWQEQAACLNHPNPDAWFPVETTDAATVEARTVCYRCPVIVECTTYALDTNQRYGIWGALTPTQRDRITKTPVTRLTERVRQSGREMCDEIEHMLRIGGRTVEQIAVSYGITVHAIVRAFHRQGRPTPRAVLDAENHQSRNRYTTGEAAA